MDINALHDILLNAKKLGAADVHVVVGSPPMMHLHDEFVPVPSAAVTTVAAADSLAKALLNEVEIAMLAEHKEIVRAFTFPDNLRCRFRIAFQKAVPSLSFHVLSERIPSLDSLRLPEALQRFVALSRGLVIIAGPYGSGRSSTATALIQEVNRTRATRILTIESPIEYILSSEKSLVEQREVGRDVPTYEEALREVADEDVGVLYVDRIEDSAVVPILLELASSRLVIAVIEAPSSIRAIEHLVNVVPARETAAIRSALSDVLAGVISQRVVPRTGGGMVAVAEVLLGTAPVEAIVREGKLMQLTNILQTSKAEGMLSLDQALAEAVRLGEITTDEALRQAVEQEYLKALLERQAK